MSTTTFLPPVSSLITLDDLPESLQFLEAGTQLLDDVYFRELQYKRSQKGDAAFYNLILVLNKEAGFTVPGTDIEVLLNPGYVMGDSTEIPLNLQYEWKLLGLLKKISSFSPSEFAANPIAFFELGLDIVGLDSNQLLGTVLKQFTAEANPIDAVNAFITDVNAKYNTSVDPVSATNFTDAVIEALDSTTAAAQMDLFTMIYELYIEDADLDASLDNINQLFSDHFGGGGIVAYLKDMLIPSISASLELGVGVAFPRDYLIPVDPDQDYEPIEDANVRSMLAFQAGAVKFSTESGIGFDESLTANLTHTQSGGASKTFPATIGKTGLIVNFEEAKLDISRKRNIPEADLDGRPSDFVGVYVKEASVMLPKKWFKDQNETTAKIAAKKVLIGTGGFSGKLSLEAVGNDPNPALVAKLGKNDGFQIGFKSFDLVFKQNAITESNLKGFLHLKGFLDSEGNEAHIDIDAHIEDDGDFSITASEDSGIDLIGIPDVFDIRLKSLSVGRKDDKFYVAVSGVVDFANQEGESGFIANTLPKDIEIQKLLIYEDGSYEFEGGGLALRKPKSLKIGPVDFTITALHFGSHEQMHNGEMRQYRYFGFDGGLSIKPGGIDARGDGIKFYYTCDNGPGKPSHRFVRIQSIALDLIIPGEAKPEEASLLLKGYLSMKEPSNPEEAGAGSEYTGSIEFTLPKMKMGGTAAMRYNPQLPAFIIDAGLEIASPIPLGPTGLGIYGFRGLIGSNYVASKQAAGLEEDAEWYQYYKAKIAPDYKEGIQVSKFEGKEGFSAGAGVSLATTSDSGKGFSSKVFLLLSLPGVFLIEGQAQIMKKRIGLDSKNDPPFYAMIEVTRDSVKSAIGAKYKMPDDGDNKGKIVKLDGLIEMAFFFNNSQAWYINIGKELPKDKRISARILDLFDAEFYLMMSAAGIKAGASITYDVEKKFGPLKAKLHAFMEQYGEISFDPVQIGGGIQLGGSLELSLFGVGFGIEAEAGISAEAPRPFVVSGMVEACVKVLWTRKCAKFNFTYVFDDQLNKDEVKLLDENIGSSVKAYHMLSKNSFELYHEELGEGEDIPHPSTWGNLDDFVIPLDSFIDFEFKKGVAPLPGGAASLDKLGGMRHPQGNTFNVSPKKAQLEQVEHRMYIEDLNIKCWNPQLQQWVDYDIYEAITAFDNPSIFDPAPDPNEMKQGFWQEDHPKQHNKIRLLSQTPLNYLVSGTGESGDTTTELFNITTESIFCQGELIQQKSLRVADAARLNPFGETVLPSGRFVAHQGVLFYLSGQDGEIISDSYQGIPQAVGLNPNESLLMIFPDPMAEVDLLMQTHATQVHVEWYTRVRTGNTDHNGIPTFEYQLVQTDVVDASNLDVPVSYADVNVPVVKAIIQAGPCQSQSDSGNGDTSGDTGSGDTSGGDTSGGGGDTGGNGGSGDTDGDTGGGGTTTDPQWIVNQEAHDLMAFFNDLAQYRDLVNPSLALAPKYYARYANSFFNSSLYGAPQKGNPVSYQASDALTSLTIDIQDATDYQAEIYLEATYPDSNFSFGQIISFGTIEPEPAFVAAGDIFNFQVDVQVQTQKGSKTYALTGRSSYAIAQGTSEAVQTSSYEQAMLQEVDPMYVFLSLALTNGKLIQSRYINISSGTYSGEFAAIENMDLFKGADFSGGVYYESDVVGDELQVRVWDNQSFRQEGTLKPLVSPLDYRQITQLGALRLESDKIVLDATMADGTSSSLWMSSPELDALKSSVGSFQGSNLTQTSQESLPSNLDMTEELTCEDLTEEAIALEQFLNEMLNHQDFYQPNGMLDPGLYAGTFYDSPLYREELEVQYDKPYLNEDGIDIHLFDEQTFDCTISLRLIDPSNAPSGIYNLSQLVNLRLDSSQISEGDTYHFLITGIDNNGNQVEIEGTSCYRISHCSASGCKTLVYQLSYLSREDYLYNDSSISIQEIQEDIDGMIGILNKTVQPIWRPNTMYAIQLKTKDSLHVLGETNDPHSASYVFGFKTAGGLGFYHNYLNTNNQWVEREDYAALKAKDEEDSYQLATLQHYVDLSKSYPNADGRLTNAKPLFYTNPELLLFFKEQYAHMMFADWGEYQGNGEQNYDLEAVIKDPLDDPLNPNPFIVGAAWERNDHPYMTQDVQILNNMMDPEDLGSPIPCVTTTTIYRFGIHSEFIVPALEPLKAYTAIFNAKYKAGAQPESAFNSREVHRYMFQTSRYGSFAEQVGSYRLVDDHGQVQAEAVFDLEVTPQDLNLVQEVLGDTLSDSHALVQAYADPFDRLIYGACQMESLPAAETTEFNIMKTEDGQILGILIRNPEPFNDPKMPASVLDSTLSVTVQGLTPLMKVFSKDNASVFVSCDDLSLDCPVDTYDFQFTYQQFDGKNYVAREHVSGIQISIA